MSSLARLNLMHYPRSRRIAEALALLWIVALADLCLTIWAHIFTPFIELNPLANAMLSKGFGPLVAFKMITTLTGTLILWHLRRHGRAEFAAWGLVLVYVLLAIRWSQYTHGAVAQAGIAFP